MKKIKLNYLYSDLSGNADQYVKILKVKDKSDDKAVLDKIYAVFKIYKHCCICENIEVSIEGDEEQESRINFELEGEVLYTT